MIRCGIIGLGKMGSIRAEALTQSGRARLDGFIEPALSQGFDGAERHETPEALLEDPGIDAVFICTPNYLNQPLTLKALRAGKHVFCEKPPAFTAAQIEEVIAAEKSSGRKLMYGFNHRHHDSVIHAKKLIGSGAYGRVLWMRGRYGKSVDADFYKDWRSKKELAGGGIMMDQGIHMLDLFLMLAGDFDQVQATVSNLYWHLDVEDNVFAIFSNRDGVMASLHSTMTQWRHLFSLEIFLEKGYMVINGLLTNSGSYGDEVLTIAKNRSAAPAATWSDEEHISFNINNSWNYEVGHFLDAIKHDKPVTTGNSHDALKVMRIMDKIYQHTPRPHGRPLARKLKTIGS
ncbi:MAG: oxidoreductase [Elusimicrobia bacterium RIFCSPHIGHO2_02_FULL_57_9]|nr:MAG: oxidoreductase [Elusimicrobia bacterium RIFCSPHIGHO2_02_FULL_57_9]